MAFVRSFGDPCQLFRVLPLSDGWVWGALWYLCRLGLSVASSLWEARPFPGSSYLTPLGKFWPPLLLLIVLQHWWKFSDLFLIVGPTVCSIISNQLWTFKLNYFQQTEHIIPHMNKLLPLLETIILTICESNMYSVSRQRLILVEAYFKMWLFLEQTRKLEIPIAKAKPAWVNLLHGWLSCTCFDPGNPSLRRGSHFGISIAQSKGCNYNLSNGIISPSFSTHSVFA